MKAMSTFSLPIRAIQQALPCWRAELRCMKFWCGSAAAFTVPAAMTMVVMYLPVESIFGLATALALLFALMILSACPSISTFFLKIGSNFVEGLPKLFLLHLLPENVSLLVAASEFFHTRTIAPPKSPPRHGARRKAMNIFTNMLFAGASYGHHDKLKH